MRLSTLFIFFLLIPVFAFPQNRDPQQQEAEKDKKLLEMARQVEARQKAEKEEAVRIAIQKGWPVRAEMDDGTLIEIKRIDENGMPEYDMTNNLDAARTSETDHLWVGGVSGLDLLGDGMLVGEWDGGGVLTSHQEFDNGSGTRVTQRDSPSGTHYHATHVAGTIVAEGQASSAHGMAPEANLDAYDWDSDLSEMITAAADDDLILSNHSYGRIRGWRYSSSNGNWYWYGNTSISSTEDYEFGFYGDLAEDWDEVAFNAPHYLIVKSAGNDRNDDHNGGHYYWNGSSWTWSTASRDPDGGSDGYDCIGNRGVAKNILTVGSVEDIPSGYSGPGDVVIASYSGWGPTDDGRIKPDIVANGQGLYSTTNTGNNDYLTISGTSMATPTVTGTLVLLQEHYDNLRGGFMSAAALKGTVINTAHEAGDADGPDYEYGWGLLNATGAADLISEDHDAGGKIVESILEEGQAHEYTYYADGSSDINVTLSWTDPPHNALTPSLNPSTIVLENNLQLRLTNDNSTFYPWILNPASPSAAATKGNNIRDNVETVNIQNPGEGYYTITVSHSSLLTNGTQAYALIIQGMETPQQMAYCEARAESTTYEHITGVNFGDIQNITGRSAGGYHDYSGMVNEMQKGNSESITVNLEGYNGSIGNAWIDWNKNGVFDAAEKIDLGTGVGPYTATVSAPSDIPSGYYTMRVRVGFQTTSACGTETFGETEDYTIKLIGTPGLWTGIVSSDWHDSMNWDDLSIPDATVNVIIDDEAPNQPVIDEWAICKNLFLQPGATLTHNDDWFDVYGSFDAGFGQFTTIGNSASLYFFGEGNVNWWDDNQNDSFNNVYVSKNSVDDVVTIRNSITTGGLISFSSGTVVLSDGVTLYVDYAAQNAITFGSQSLLALSDDRTIHTTGGFVFADGSQSTISGGTLICGMDFQVNNNPSFDHQFTGTTLVFDGTVDQYIIDEDGGSLVLHNLQIDDPNTTLYISNHDLNLEGDVTISSGTLSNWDSPDQNTSHTISLKGDWANYAGEGGFEPGDGRVIFNGPGHQYITTDETFNILEVNNGAALRINNPSTEVTCEVYDWTAGGIDVVAGTFTINDLYDSGMYGTFWCNPDGELNINQDAGQFIDLNGELHVFGGTVNVLGGSYGWWPYDGDALVEVSGGELNFESAVVLKASGIFSFNEDITGGVIRFNDLFMDERGDFNPEGGTIEFTGSEDVQISQTTGSHFYDLLINKTDGVFSKAMGPESTQKMQNQQGKTPDGRDLFLPQSTRAANQTVFFTSDIDVKNDLMINEGFLQCGELSDDSYTLELWGDLGGSPNSFIPHEGTVFFDQGTDNQITTDMDFYNVQIAKFEFFELGSVTLADGISVDIANNLSVIHGTFALGQNNMLNIGNNVNINGDALLDASLGTNSEITISGNWYNQNFTNDGTKGFSPGLTTVTFNGSDQQFIDSDASNEFFNNLVINNSYWAALAVLSPLTCYGDLHILDGAIGNNEPYYFHGDVIIEPDGVFIGTSTVSFIGLDPAVYENNSSVASAFMAGVVLNKSSESTTLTLSTDMAVGSDFDLEKGTLDLNGNTLFSSSVLNVTSEAVVHANAGSQIILDNDAEINVENGGKINLLGADGNPVLVSGFGQDGSSRYDFLVQSGGTIAAEYAIFEYMKTDGIQVLDGANIDPVQNFSSCVFRNGDGTGVLLTIDNAQVLNITNAHFPNNTAEVNVAKFLNQGQITFTDYTGSFSGEDFDYDPYDRIDWYEAELAVSPAVQNVGAPAGSTIFSITSNLDWSINETTPWFSVNPDSGNGDGTLTVDYQGNTSLSSRSGEITISADGVPDVVVTVIQAGISPFLTITPESAFVDPDAGSTTFNLSSNTDWTVSETYGWVSVSPSSGNGNTAITVFYTQNPGVNYRYADIEISAAGGTLNETFQLTQNAYESQALNIPEGWSGISSFIMPADNAIINVMAPVGSNLVIMQTMNEVLYPDGSINTIGTWDSQSAYKIKLEAASSLNIIGEEETDKTIGMNAGWSLLPVISNIPVDAASLFGGTDLVLIKEVAGPGLIWPEYGINTLGSDLYPGMSYYVLMGSAGSITFPPNAKSAGNYEVVQTEIPGHPWNRIAEGPSSHVIAIKADGLSGMMPGDVIGVFDASGNCFGVSQITSLSENTALSAYANDPWTAAKDGFDEAEPMLLKHYRPETGETSDVWVEWDQSMLHTGYFIPEGMSAIADLKTSSLGSVGSFTADQISMYPNPATTMVQISGLENFGQIEIINASGRLVKSLSTEAKRKIEINVSDFAPGVYQVRFSGDRSTVVRKLIRK